MIEIEVVPELTAIKEEIAGRNVPDGVRIYVDEDGCVSEPAEQWADGSDRLPNHHNSWFRVWPNREADLLALVEGLMSRGFRPDDDLFFHTSTHNCFTDQQLREYRVRQRQHAVRRIKDQVAAIDPSDHATGSRDFGRGFAYALSLVGDILEREAR